ncbi:hypothetical protein BDW60DRAFT_89400 [Aspergillus nidulans var. acristatus]
MQSRSRNVGVSVGLDRLSELSCFESSEGSLAAVAPFKDKHGLRVDLYSAHANGMAFLAGQQLLHRGVVSSWSGLNAFGSEPMIMNHLSFPPSPAPFQFLTFNSHISLFECRFARGLQPRCPEGLIGVAGRRPRSQDLGCWLAALGGVLRELNCTTRGLDKKSDSHPVWRLSFLTLSKGESRSELLLPDAVSLHVSLSPVCLSQMGNHFQRSQHPFFSCHFVLEPSKDRRLLSIGLASFDAGWMIPDAADGSERRLEIPPTVRQGVPRCTNRSPNSRKEAIDSPWPTITTDSSDFPWGNAVHSG